MNQLLLKTKTTNISQTTKTNSLMKTSVILASVFLGLAMATAALGQTKTNSTGFSYKTEKVDGLDIFYREAGSPSAPTILFLHGFPSSSHMYRDVMNDLKDSYHVIAPDYPGFGNSSFPSKDEFKYNFDNLASVIEKFIDAKGLKKFTLYVQDYGSPVGFRIASRRPELISALIIQNAIAHPDGIGPYLAAFPPFWKERNATTEKPLRDFLTINGTKLQYLDGAESPDKISPDAYNLDQSYLDRPGNVEAQLDLFSDYQNNVAQFAVWQDYFTKKQPAALIIWGKNDKFFTTAGAEAYKKQLKNVEIHLFNSGHFALEEHHAEAAKLIKNFMTKRNIK